MADDNRRRRRANALEAAAEGTLAQLARSHTPREAMKALAIVARTYALQATRTGEALPCPAGRPAAAQNVALAMRETAGMALTYGGEVIRPMLTTSNGGQTAAMVGLPYTRIRADPWDTCARQLATAQGRPAAPRHGAGLSLIGAEYAAQQGEDCADILAFYYPGASITIIYDQETERCTWTTPTHGRSSCAQRARRPGPSPGCTADGATR